MEQLNFLTTNHFGKTELLMECCFRIMNTTPDSKVQFYFSKRESAEKWITGFKKKYGKESCIKYISKEHLSIKVVNGSYLSIIIL